MKLHNLVILFIFFACNNSKSQSNKFEIEVATVDEFITIVKNNPKKRAFDTLSKSIFTNGNEDTTFSVLYISMVKKLIDTSNFVNKKEYKIQEFTEKDFLSCAIRIDFYDKKNKMGVVRFDFYKLMNRNQIYNFEIEEYNLPMYKGKPPTNLEPIHPRIN